MQSSEAELLACGEAVKRGSKCKRDAYKHQQQKKKKERKKENKRLVLWSERDKARFSPIGGCLLEGRGSLQACMARCAEPWSCVMKPREQLAVFRGSAQDPIVVCFFFLFDASGTAAYPESGRPVLRSAVRKCARPEVAFSSFPPLVVIFHEFRRHATSRPCKQGSEDALFFFSLSFYVRD